MIGRAGTLPWHLPADMRRFRELTTGHAVIMGRRTYDTLGRPLPERRNLVVTRSTTYHPAGVEIVHTIDGAFARVADDPEVYVAGGGEIYRIALPVADRIYLTVVHAIFEGDARFPEFTMDEWRLAEDLRFPSDARHAVAYSFRRYERRVARDSDLHHDAR